MLYGVEMTRPLDLIIGDVGQDIGSFNLTPIEKVSILASFEKTKEFRLNR